MSAKPAHLDAVLRFEFVAGCFIEEGQACYRTNDGKIYPCVTGGESWITWVPNRDYHEGELIVIYVPTR